MQTHIFILTIGLVLGSFVNVVIYRLPRGISLWRRSRCPCCNRPIMLRDLVPVLSYIRLRSTCRWCKNRISCRYPVIEVVVAIGITLAIFTEPDILTGMLNAAVFIILVSIMAIDWQWYRIPNALTGGLLLIAGLRIITHPGRIPDALYGALVGAGLLLILGITGWILQGEYGFGMGDIKLIAALGLLAGPAGILQTLMWAISMGGLLAGVGLATGRLHRHSRLPFAVFLGMGIYMQKIIQPLELIREVGIW